MNRADLLSLADALAGPYRICPPDLRAAGRSGVFAGTGDGQSVDFHDFREYQPGDDLRRVDWLAYARSGQMHLKLFREEVSPVVELYLDTSASMGAYPGKEQTALFAAAFLRRAALAAEGRPVLCRDGGRFFGPDFEAALAGVAFSGTGGDDIPRAAAGRPLRFHLGDYLSGDGLEGRFRKQAGGSLLFTPVLILSASEREPGWRGYHRLFDVENPGAALDLAVTETAVAAYRKRLHAHIDGLGLAARRVGGRLLRLDAPDGELGRAECEAIVRRLAGEGVVTAR